MNEKLLIPNFETDKELFDFIVKNEKQLIAQKKASMKKADGFGCLAVLVDKSINNKNNKTNNNSNKDYIDVTVVINTTNILDSHKDVHIPGIWNKSIKENKRILHVQEHKANEFNKIISSGEDLQAYTKTFMWRELGYDVEGKTEALVFKSRIHKSRNKYMFEQYSKGFVDNHSVGMIYVKIHACINDEDYAVQKENYDKYYPMIVNKLDADNVKWFWAVTEAKVVEGSAVPNGSNRITPTLSVDKNNLHDIESKKIKAYKAFLNIN